MKNNIEKIYFAGGCFWGVEYFFQNLKGVISTQVGYIGGNKNNPTYEDVCNETTGHAESVEVLFDNKKISFEKIAKLFLKFTILLKKMGKVLIWAINIAQKYSILQKNKKILLKN